MSLIFRSSSWYRWGSSERGKWVQPTASWFMSFPWIKRILIMDVTTPTGIRYLMSPGLLLSTGESKYCFIPCNRPYYLYFIRAGISNEILEAEERDRPCLFIMDIVISLPWIVISKHIKQKRCSWIFIQWTEFAGEHKITYWNRVKFEYKGFLSIDGLY